MEALGILLILILVTAAVVVVNLVMSEPIEIPRCTGAHTWVTDQTEKLVCTECGYRPQSNN